MTKLSILLILTLLFTGLSFMYKKERVEACGYAFSGGCNSSYYYGSSYNYPSYNHTNYYRYNNYFYPSYYHNYNYGYYNTNTAFNNYGNYYKRKSYCYNWWGC